MDHPVEIDLTPAESDSPVPAPVKRASQRRRTDQLGALRHRLLSSNKFVKRRFYNRLEENGARRVAACGVTESLMQTIGIRAKVLVMRQSFTGALASRFSKYIDEVAERCMILAQLRGRRTINESIMRHAIRTTAAATGMGPSEIV